MKYLVLISLTLSMVCCSDQTKPSSINLTVAEKTALNNHYIEFKLEEKTISINGKSDINSEFYTKQWPEQHNTQSIKKMRLENQNVYCGRICTSNYTEMIELFFTYPDDKKLKISDLKNEINKKVYTYVYDKKNNQKSDLSFRAYYFNSIKEYTSDNESEGYIKIESIESITDSTITAAGIFDFNMYEYGKVELKNVKGKFNLEFYIGL